MSQQQASQADGATGRSRCLRRAPPLDSSSISSLEARLQALAFETSPSQTAPDVAASAVEQVLGNAQLLTETLTFLGPLDLISKPTVVCKLRHEIALR